MIFIQVISTSTIEGNVKDQRVNMEFLDHIEKIILVSQILSDVIMKTSTTKTSGAHNENVPCIRKN